MGTLLNGIKEIFATSQSTATHLPVCASDGTPQGRISVGELASVLGAMTSKGLLSLNWNSDDVEQGVYQIQPSQQTDLPSGITDRAVIMIGRASASSEYYRFALLCDASSNTVKRYWINTFRSTWNGWAELTFDMPSFYKDYSTLVQLGTALKCFMPSSPIDDPDANEYTTQGLYSVHTTGRLTPANMHLPTSYNCYLMVIGGSLTYGILQISIVQDGTIYMRSKQQGSSGAWTEWVKIV